MEEQSKSKEIKMDTAKNGNGEKKELTFDQLKDLAQKVFDENRELQQRLYKAHEALNMFNRLDYLFKVVEIASQAQEWKFSDEFVSMCIGDIEKAMTPPKEETEKSQEN